MTSVQLFNAIQSGKRPMRCEKLTGIISSQNFPEWVVESFPPKEDGSGVVRVIVPGTLKEATTQEALQRGVVVAITWQNEPTNGSDVIDIIKHYQAASSLSTVHIRNCFLGVSGGKYLAKSLQDISTLFLDGNDIRDGGCMTISAALAANTNLKTLGLVNESIGYQGARYLANALQFNMSLTKLDISGNDIEKDGCREIAFALQRNSGSVLKYLKMDQKYGGIVNGEYQGLLRAFKLQFQKDSIG
ncbi:hypothetical protein GUITHDRAFT_155180 [Guillardia theta CCMP2712]|uniref:Uncharacterized protein n=2 Tax=Guillardia theta TaxID=55529 RepID=L1IL50_GUITC|nr:hypothetical protein GUITHDRAFT_155180 [Guillardia theta CCMP2712]EKX36634.1 hypothetical protein GUITHDRAFT_155180 [Guillardia theta CCMP2712]|eukprot:XP_005823614.1 hypothetical protein GUITHDRAFT_155180 [Guillardia theta CCMP2712]